MIVFVFRTQHHTLAVCFRSAENHCLPACFSIVVQTFATDFCRTMTSLPLNSGSPLPNFASPSGPSGPELGVWVPSWPVPNLIVGRRLSRLPKSWERPAGDPDPKFWARWATWGDNVGEGRAGIKGPWSRHCALCPLPCSRQVVFRERRLPPSCQAFSLARAMQEYCLSTPSPALQDLVGIYVVQPAAWNDRTFLIHKVAYMYPRDRIPSQAKSPHDSPHC
jgi:hypothetical protein